MAVSLSLVAKKAAAALASNKKGRKAIAYVIGMVLFLILLPVIIMTGLFGWMQGDTSMNLNEVQIGIDQYATDYSEQLIGIEKAFAEQEINESNLKKADYIFVYHLTEHAGEENYYKNFADCFSQSTAEKSVYTLVTERFGVEFSEEDIRNLDELYGVTAPGGK